MALLTMEHPAWNIRVAVNLDKLTAENGIRDVENLYQLQQVMRDSTKMISDFVSFWHRAQDKTAVMIPPWIVYIQYMLSDDGQTKGKRKARRAPVSVV